MIISTFRPRKQPDAYPAEKWIPAAAVKGDTGVGWRRFLKRFVRRRSRRYLRMQDRVADGGAP